MNKYTKNASEETHQLIIADAWVNIGRETV